MNKHSAANRVCDTRERGFCVHGVRTRRADGAVVSSPWIERPMGTAISITVLLVALSTGCAGEPTATRSVSGAVTAAQGAARILDGARVVDLTYPFDDKTIYWPTATTGFVHETVFYGKTEGRLLLLGVQCLRAGARRHAPRRTRPLRRWQIDCRHRTAVAPHWPSGSGGRRRSSGEGC